MTDTKEIEVLIRARYPILYIVSWEEQRVVESLLQIGKKSNKKVYEWTCSGGIAPAGTSVQSQKMRNAGTKDPLVALNEVTEQMEPAIYIFKDFHPFLANNNYSIIRKLRDISHNLKSSYKTLIILSPFMRIPEDLEKDITIIDYQLPNIEILGKLLDNIIDQVKDNPQVKIDLSPANREQILQAALGLTVSEAENVFAKAIVTDGRLCVDDIEKILYEKQQIIRKSGLLDYCKADIDFEKVGGLDSLKEWLIQRKSAFSSEAAQFGLPVPRGVMMVGVQGCGKSLCAKAISSIWNFPLLRFDVGKMFSSFLGTSEENVRRAIQIAESIAPCVLWIDEIDKAFSGLGGSSTDSGTSQRVLGTILTWLSEKKSSVFVAATANNIEVLPPELLRKGRFDEIFFVDLPSAKERENVFGIHLEKRKRNLDSFDLGKLAFMSEGFSGAEIEEVVITALYHAFYENREITNRDMERAIKETVPLSKTMEERILKMREWCLMRTRNASILPQEVADKINRKLEII